MPIIEVQSNRLLWDSQRLRPKKTYRAYEHFHVVLRTPYRARSCASILFVTEVDRIFMYAYEQLVTHMCMHFARTIGPYEVNLRGRRFKFVVFFHYLSRSVDAPLIWTNNNNNNNNNGDKATTTVESVRILSDMPGHASENPSLPLMLV